MVNIIRRLPIITPYFSPTLPFSISPSSFLSHTRRCFCSSLHLHQHQTNLTGGLFHRANTYKSNTAIVVLPENIHPTKKNFISYSYGDLLYHSSILADVISPVDLKKDTKHLEYVLKDSQCLAVVVSPEYETILKPIANKMNLRLILLDSILPEYTESVPFPTSDHIEGSKKAMILYTNGPTGPKGVVLTHHALEAQVKSQSSLWRWSSNDRVLQVLPLHYYQGVVGLSTHSALHKLLHVNVLTCALWNGAVCEMMPSFNASKVWDRLLLEVGPAITVFMGVPVMYSKLVDYSVTSMGAVNRQQACNLFKSVKLFACGGAFVPDGLSNKWEGITGQQLVEHYGMTETGTILSQPMRVDSSEYCPKLPAPGISVKLADYSTYEDKEYVGGELFVRSTGIFKEYWNNPTATAASFSYDGWFQTGDLVNVGEEGAYDPIGREGVDIFTSNGYEIFTPAIEEVIRLGDQIKDCVVLGIPDERWRRAIAAIVVMKSNPKSVVRKTLTLKELVEFLRPHIPLYKIPTCLVCVDEIPLNLAGVINKTNLISLLAGQEKQHRTEQMYREKLNAMQQGHAINRLNKGSSN